MKVLIPDSAMFSGTALEYSWFRHNYITLIVLLLPFCTYSAQLFAYEQRARFSPFRRLEIHSVFVFIFFLFLHCESYLPCCIGCASAPDDSLQNARGASALGRAQHRGRPLRDFNDSRRWNASHVFVTKLMAVSLNPDPLLCRSLRKEPRKRENLEHGERPSRPAGTLASK